MCLKCARPPALEVSEVTVQRRLWKSNTFRATDTSDLAFMFERCRSSRQVLISAPQKTATTTSFCRLEDRFHFSSVCTKTKAVSDSICWSPEITSLSLTASTGKAQSHSRCQIACRLESPFAGAVSSTDNPPT